MATIDIAPATSRDLDTVMTILDEAARWLLAKGIKQWQSPPPAEVYDMFRDYIREGSVYLVREASAPDVVGVFRLHWHACHLWPEDQGDSAYLYTLALRPAQIGQGMGASVIGWVSELVRRRGKKFLRLDCIAANQRLRAWYEALGFEYVRTAVDGDYTLALFQSSCDNR